MWSSSLLGVGQAEALVVQVFPLCGDQLSYLYVWGGMFGVDWQVFQNNLIDSMLNKIKL